jgi:hypothetical protein
MAIWTDTWHGTAYDWGVMQTSHLDYYVHVYETIIYPTYSYTVLYKIQTHLQTDWGNVTYQHQLRVGDYTVESFVHSFEKASVSLPFSLAAAITFNEETGDITWNTNGFTSSLNIHTHAGGPVSMYADALSEKVTRSGLLGNATPGEVAPRSYAYYELEDFLITRDGKEFINDDLAYRKKYITTLTNGAIDGTLHQVNRYGTCTWELNTPYPIASLLLVNNKDTTLSDSKNSGYIVKVPKPVFSALFTDSNNDAENFSERIGIQVSGEADFSNLLLGEDKEISSIFANNRCEDIEYDGDRLGNKTTYYVRIKFYDSTNKSSNWTAGDFDVSLPDLSVSHNPYGQGFRAVSGGENGAINFSLHEGDFNYSAPSVAVQGKLGNIICLPDGRLRLTYVNSAGVRAAMISANDGETWQEE